MLHVTSNYLENELTCKCQGAIGKMQSRIVSPWKSQEEEIGQIAF